MAAIKPEVLLLDLSLPRLRRLTDIPAIQQASPRTAVLLLVGGPHESQAISALKAGVRGYCSIRISSKLLRRAVERIRSGEIWAGRDVLSRLVTELSLLVARQNGPVGAANLDVLTPRERQIAGFVSEGATNKEIGARLSISEGTVKARLGAIFRKLDCSNRVRLALIVKGESSLKGQLTADFARS